MLKRILNHFKTTKGPLPKDAETRLKQIQSKYNLSEKMGDLDYFPSYSRRVSSSGYLKLFHDKPVDEIVNIIEQPPAIFRQKQGLGVQLSKTEGEFRSLSIDLPEKAWEVLLKFEDKNKENAPAWAWGEFFIGLNSILSDKPSYTNNKISANETKSAEENTKKTAIEKRTKLFIKALKKAEIFDDDFLKLDGLLYPLVGIFYEKRGLTFFYKDKKYFKTWWLRLWGLSLESYKPLSEKDDYSFDALNSNTGKLTQIVFRILWNLVIEDKKILKKEEMPPSIKKDYFDILQYFDIILKKSSKNPSHFFHFGSDLSKLWHLDREWTVNNLKPLMGWRSLNTAPAQKSKETLNPQSEDMIQHSEGIRKALWAGYLFYDEFLGPDFLMDFKEEFFDLIVNYKSIHPEYLPDIVEVFFISTGGMNIKNIFNKEESQELARHIDKDLLENLSQYILNLFRDSEKDKSADLWATKIKPWMKDWPKQKNKNSPEIAKNLSLIILRCDKNLPDAFKDLKNKIRDEIQENDFSIVYDICDEFKLTKDSDFGLHESSSMTAEDKGDKILKKDENKMQNIFDYPEQLLNLLNWNLPEERILYNIDNVSVKKILEKLKSLNPHIEQNELFKKLEDKLEN